MPIYHLLLRNSQWMLVEEGAGPVIKSFWTKVEAVTYSLALIERRGGSLTIHRLDGEVQEERSFPMHADMTVAEPLRSAA